MGLILKTGAILSGNVALTSDGVQEVRQPQWDDPIVRGSMSDVYGSASKLLLEGTEVTGGTILFNEPSSISASLWSNALVRGSMSDVYGSDSKLLLEGTEVTGGTILFNEPSSTTTSIWANPVVRGSMSDVYGSDTKLLLEGTEVTGGVILDGFAEPDDSIWANPVVRGSMSDVYGSTSRITITLVSSSPTLLVGPGVTYSGGSEFGTGHEGQTQWGPGPSAAFDANPSSEFHTIASGTRNLGYDFGQLQHVSSYKMHARLSGRPHVLTGWDVMTSDDGVSWRKIGEERNISWPDRFGGSDTTYPDDDNLNNVAWKEFTISDSVSGNMFRYLRLDFVSTNDGYGYMVVPGLAFFTDLPSADVTEFNLSGNLESVETLSSGDVLTLDAAAFNTSYHSTSFTVDKSTTMEMHLWGAGGGGTKRSSGVTGGKGGYSAGTYTFVPGVEYHIVVGGGGEGGSQNPSINTAWGALATGGGANEQSTGSEFDGSGGGGYTGIFAGSVSQGSAIIIAGGGGGGSGDIAVGGDGGGTTGGNGSNGGRAGAGGSQTAGGSGVGGPGSALQGGTGTGVGAGGGGGYFGGAGGGNTGPGAGGGGSGYISPELTDSSTSTWTTNSYHKSNAGAGGSNGQQGNSGLLVLRKLAA